MRCAAALFAVCAAAAPVRADLAADCAAQLPKGTRLAANPDDKAHEADGRLELVPAGALSGTQRGVALVLPKRLDAATLQLPGGAEVHVRDADGTGEATVFGPSACYRRGSGVGYWASEEHGYWLWLSGPFALAVDGMTAREAKGKIELVEHGAIRLAVAAQTADGKPVALALAQGKITAAARGFVRVSFEAPTWRYVGENFMRFNHTATVLGDGRVLIAGGSNNRSDAGDEYGAYTPTENFSAMTYDPAKDKFTATKPMVTPRHSHIAVALADGRVLIAGGDHQSYPQATAELFDPKTGAWTATGAMHDVRYDFAAVPLVDGRVFVAGGTTIAFAMSRRAEIYDPRTGTWTRVHDMARPRSHLTLTRLADGRVLALAKTGEIYDPKTDRWEAIPAPTHARWDHAAALLADGRVLVAGGTDENGAVVATEIYDPKTRAWSSAAPTGFEQPQARSVVLADGRVAIAGTAAWRNGPHSRFIEVYEPKANRWTFAPGFGYGGGPGPGLELVTLRSGEIMYIGSNDPNAPGGGVCDASCGF